MAEQRGEASGPSTYDWINAAFVLVLGLLALSTMDQSFADRTYLLVGGVALVVPLAIALLWPRFGQPPSRYALVAYLLFLPLAGLTAFRDLRPNALIDAARATVDAPGILLSFVPPLASDGPVLIMPFALGYLAGAAGTWLALRSQRAFAPVAVLFLVLVLTVLLGTESVPSLPLRAVLWVGLAIWWVAIRVEHDPHALGSVQGTVFRAGLALAAVGFVVGLVSVWVGPQADRVVLRGVLGQGYAVDTLGNPLADLQQFHDRSGNGKDAIAAKRLLRVRGLPRNVPLRFTVLDTYDGTEWTPGNDTVDGTREDRFQEIGERVGTDVAGTEVHAEVDLAPTWSGDWIPLTGYLTRFSFADTARLADVRYNPATGTAAAVEGLGPKDDYEFDAVVPDPTFPEGAAAYPNDGDLQPEGAFLDSFLEPWRDADVSTLDQVLLMAEYLKLSGLSVGTGAAGHSAERLEAFAFDPKGDGEQYAAFVALAANRLGVPARVVVGAQPNEAGVVKGDDVAAWVEVRVKDGSWRTLPTESFIGERKRNQPAESAEDFLDRKQRERDKQSNSKNDRRDDSSSTEAEDGSGPPWRLLLGILALILIVGAVPAWKVRRRRRRRSLIGVAGVVAAWHELLDASRDLGFSVSSGRTRPDQVAELAASVSAGATASAENGLGESLHRLAERADTLAFGREIPSQASIDALWGDVLPVIDQLRGSADPRRRWWARWNPNSLR